MLRAQIAYHRFARGTISRPSVAAALALGVLGTGAGGCSEDLGTVDAPAPVQLTSADVDSVASLPPGIIIAPLTLDLAGPFAALEQIVPKRIGDITQRQPIRDSPRKSYAFALRREPFAVSFKADTVLLDAIIHYQGRGWYDPPIGPTINGECGTRGQPPRARLLLRVVPRLDRDWRVRVRTRVVEVTALTDSDRDRCQVTFLKVDVTDTVLAVARRALQGFLPQLERRIARIDVKTPLAKIWDDLQKPIRLSDSLWLMLAPGTVHLGSLKGTGATATAEIGITASPRIVTGTKPDFRPFPLPPLGPVKTDLGFSLLIEGAFDYGVMSAELTTRLAGQSVRAAGGVLKVRKVTVYGVGSGRLALGLDFEGTARGRVWLVGKPSYDPTTGMLSVPDLEFDAGSAGILVQGLAWLKGDAIREFLRTQAQVSAGDLLSRIETLAVKQMNRELARGVRLSATIERSEPAGILIRSDGLILRARAIGAARLDLGRELFQRKQVKGF